MKPNIERNAGARIERRSVLSKLARLIRGRAGSEQPYDLGYVHALNVVRSWLKQRKDRTAVRLGGIGKK